MNSLMNDPKHSPRLDAPRVLLVDDERDLRSAMVRYLTISGFAVTEAANGEAAIAAIDAGPCFHFLLTDLQLPDVDGIEVARHARSISPTIWIALITGWPLESDDPRVQQIDHVLLKPVNLAELCLRLKDRSSTNGTD